MSSVPLTAVMPSLSLDALAIHGIRARAVHAFLHQRAAAKELEGSG